MKFNLAEFAKGYLATQVGMQQGKQQQELLAQEQQRQMFAQNLQTQQLELQQREVDQRGELAKQQFEQTKLEAQAQAQYRADSLKQAADDYGLRVKAFDAEDTDRKAARALVPPELITNALSIYNDYTLDDTTAKQRVTALADSLPPEAKAQYLRRIEGLPRNTELPRLQAVGNQLLKTIPELFKGNAQIEQPLVGLTTAVAGSDVNAVKSAITSLTTKLPAAFVGKEAKEALANAGTLAGLIKPKYRQELLGLSADLQIAQQQGNPEEIGKAQMALAAYSRKLDTNAFVANLTPAQEAEADARLTQALSSVYQTPELASAAIRAHFKAAQSAGTPYADQVAAQFFPVPGDTIEQQKAKEAAFALQTISLSTLENPGQLLTALHAQALDLVQRAGDMSKPAYAEAANLIISRVQDPVKQKTLQRILFKVPAGWRMQHDKEMLMQRLKSAAEDASSDVGRYKGPATPLLTLTAGIIEDVNKSIGWSGSAMDQLIASSLTGDVDAFIAQGNIPNGVTVDPKTKKIVLSPAVERQVRRWVQAKEIQRLSSNLLLTNNPSKARQLAEQIQQAWAIPENQYPIAGLFDPLAVDAPRIGPPNPGTGNLKVGPPNPGIGGGPSQGRVPAPAATGDPIKDFMSMAAGTANGIARAVAGADTKEATKGSSNLDAVAPPPKVKSAPKPAAPAAVPKPTGQTKPPPPAAPRGPAPVRETPAKAPVRKDVEAPAAVRVLPTSEPSTRLPGAPGDSMRTTMERYRAAAKVNEPEAKAALVAFGRKEMSKEDLDKVLDRVAKSPTVVARPTKRVAPEASKREPAAPKKLPATVEAKAAAVARFDPTAAQRLIEAARTGRISVGPGMTRAYTAADAEAALDNLLWINRNLQTPVRSR